MDNIPDLPQEKEPETAPEQAQARKRGVEAYLNVRTLVTVLAALILIFTFVVRVVIVSGPSMEDTLQNGDALLVWTLGYSPRQGDIVVLTQPSYQRDSIVKRVIATGGQTVDIDYAANTVYVDGVPLEEEYIKEAMRVPGYGEGNNHLTVPEGCLFVMGDNRNESADSRYPVIGIIDQRCVIGRALLVFFPFSHLELL